MEAGIKDLWEKCRAEHLQICVPGLPPSVNKLYATVRGRRVKSRESRLYQTQVAHIARQAAMITYGTHDLSSLRGRPLRFGMLVLRPSWRAKSGSKLYVRPDLSNFIKACEDSVISALGLDDSAVVELIATKIEHDGVVRTVVRLSFL